MAVIKLLTVSAAALACLVTASNNFNFTPTNIEHLEQTLRTNLNEKITHNRHQAQKKLIRTVREISKSINNFDFNTCVFNENDSGDVENYWETCNQCIAQQCTAYLDERCDNGFPHDLFVNPEVFNNASPEIIELAKIVQEFNSQNSAFQLVIDFNGGLRVVFKDDVLTRRKRSVSSKNKRAKRSACGQATITCEGHDCQNLEFPSVEEVICVNETPEKLRQQGLEFSDEKTTQQWTILTESINEFEMTAVDRGDETMVIIDLSKALQSGLIRSMRVSNDPPFSATAEGEYTNQEEYIETENYEFTGNDDDYIVADYLTYDYTTRKRRDTNDVESDEASCEEIIKTPARCYQLNLDNQCKSCDKILENMCGDYQELRKSLSKELDSASTLIESLEVDIANHEQNYNWYSALGGSSDQPLVYVQRAHYNEDTGKIVLAIGLGQGELAKQAFAVGTLPEGITFEEFEVMVGQEVAALI